MPIGALAKSGKLLPNRFRQYIKLIKPKTDLLPVIVQNQTKQRQQKLADN